VFTKPDGHTRFFHDYGQLEQYARQQAATQEVYFGVGLIAGQPRGRGKAQDVAAIGALWCDVDVRGPAHPRANLPASIAEAEALLAEMPLAPSIIVHSGHGLHGYWLLKEPWVFEDQAQREQAASLARRWHGVVCDLATRHGWTLENLGDLTRVLRLPGTLNHHGDGEPVPVELTHCEPTRRYDVEDFEPYLPPIPQRKDPPEPAIEPLLLRADAEPPADRLVTLTEQSPAFRATWKRQRDDLGDSSQSGYDLSLATIAALSGWSDQQIANLIIAHRRHGGANPDKALRDGYVRQTIGKARRTVNDNQATGEMPDISALLQRTAAGPNGAVGQSDRANGANVPGGGSITTRLSDVTPVPVQWLWPKRIPLGKLTMLAGEPGLGKSFLTLDLAARVSTGAGWPCLDFSHDRPGGVVLLSAEDDVTDTIRPRLDVAGADCARIIALHGVRYADGKQELFKLPDHLTVLSDTIAQLPDCRLVVIDPVSAFLGETDSHNNSEVRGVLAPLANMAAEHGVAVLAVTHLNKGTGSAINRSIGSIAFVAAARAAYLVARDRDDFERRLLLPVKNNLGSDQGGYAFRLEGDPISKVAWEPSEVNDRTADEAVGCGTKRRGPEPSAQDDCTTWLIDRLAKGPRPAGEMWEEAEAEGFARKTVQRAKRRAGITSEKSSQSGGWLWLLPGCGPLMDSRAQWN